VEGIGKMALLVINVGNTRVQYGTFSGGKIHGVKYFPTSELLAGKKPVQLQGSSLFAVASTVVPEARKILRSKNILWIGRDSDLPISLKKVDSSTLGADRIANSVAAAKFARLPAIILDCGTAITVDAVNSRREFIGGAILPGRMLLHKSLNDFTAQLPLVSISGRKPKALGKNTVSAILSGTDLAVIGSVKEVIAGIVRESGFRKYTVLIVGGDADYFVRNIPGAKSGGEDFTLKGIATCFDFDTGRK
jgi:type III pantothenate kinase